MPVPMLFAKFTVELMSTAAEELKLEDDSGAFKSLARALFATSPMLTSALGLAVSYLVEYALSDLYYSLAIVERDVGAGQRLRSHDKVDPGERPKDVVHTDFITSSIRSTFRRLYREAGDFSMLRGFGSMTTILFIYGILQMAVQPAFRYVAGKTWFPLYETPDVIVSVLMSQLTAAWLHVVMTKPTLQFWFRRLPLTWLGVVKATWIVTVALVLAEGFIEWLPTFVARYTPSAKGKEVDLNDLPEVSVGLRHFLWPSLRLAAVALVEPLLTALLYVPVKIVAKRIEASMLPAEEETVIPVDKSFGHNYSSAGTETLSTRNAIRTVDGPTHRRIAKAYLKIYLLCQLVEWLFWTLTVVEVRFVAGQGVLWVLLKNYLGVTVTKQDFAGLSALANSTLVPLLRNSTNSGNSTSSVTTTIMLSSTQTMVA